MGKPMIVANEVRKSFGKHEVLKGVSFEIEEGKVGVVMGPSGCGKSTLLRILIGADRPDSGEVFLDGEEITRMDEEQLNKVRLKFGMLFQGSALLNSMTVAENVSLPIRQHTPLPPETIDIMVKLKLEMVGLRNAESLLPAEISGGMKKRVSLARAIALDPKIVFYDEPSAGLDPVMVAVIDALVMDLRDKIKVTSLVVTHEMTSAFRIADHMVMLHEGTVLSSGPPEEIRKSDNGILQQFIKGEADGPIPLKVAGSDYEKAILQEE
ncbi:MAG: ABC transporter ATP-binding protein [Planctomycetota bacterium]|nr:ABC transporter ATP-binding protein [Planctomycetota bacterium]